MKPTEPEPLLTAEEQAFADALRACAGPAAAPGGFARRLLVSGPPSSQPSGPAPWPTLKFRLIATGAAAAVVTLGWISLHPPQGTPRESAGAAQLPNLVGQSIGEPAPLQSSPDIFDDRSALRIHDDPMFSVRELGVIRRTNGLPPVRLVAVDGVRVLPEGTQRRIEIESRIIPLVLEYH